MSMDPDGTNRIIKQQIKEWQAFVEGGRTAKLAEPEVSGARLLLVFRAADALRGLIGNLALHRTRSVDEV